MKKIDWLVRPSNDVVISRYKFNNKVKCGLPAPPWIDEYNDECGNEPCLREAGHKGEHMASDGANGWHYWKNNETVV